MIKNSIIYNKQVSLASAPGRAPPGHLHSAPTPTLLAARRAAPARVFRRRFKLVRIARTSLLRSTSAIRRSGKRWRGGSGRRQKAHHLQVMRLSAMRPPPGLPSPWLQMVPHPTSQRHDVKRF